MNSAAVLDHQVVSKSRWFSAYSDFLAKEKELTRLSDELSRQRRGLPWTLVEKEYVFEGPQGKVSLADLFNGRSQLATYHFMFGPDWAEGCPSCSYVTDHLDGALEHLQARDVTLVLVSRGPLDKLQAFKKRMGWRLPWFSSGGCDFNRDFGVSFTKAEVDSRAKAYNFGTTAPHGEENPGLSFFFKRSDGAILHTYSTFGRGLEAVLGTYAILDRAPKGRDEAGLPMPMAWVRHHDKYEPTLQGAGSCCHNKAGH
ncbi:MAG TPA: thioredoxin family protein [Gemmataceae bacterium]|nr:thioredoxin family protein [Gemmataceae bacterium]